MVLGMQHTPASPCLGSRFKPESGYPFLLECRLTFLPLDLALTIVRIAG